MTYLTRRIVTDIKITPFQQKSQFAINSRSFFDSMVNMLHITIPCQGGTHVDDSEQTCSLFALHDLLHVLKTCLSVLLSYVDIT